MTGRQVALHSTSQPGIRIHTYQRAGHRDDAPDSAAANLRHNARNPTQSHLTRKRTSLDLTEALLEGESGSGDEAVENAGLVLQALETVAYEGFEAFEAVGGQIRQAAFDVGPHGLDRAQVRGVGGSNYTRSQGRAAIMRRIAAERWVPRRSQQTRASHPNGRSLYQTRSPGAQGARKNVGLLDQHG